MSDASRVPEMEEVSSAPEPVVSPVIAAGSSTALTDVESVSSIDEIEEVPPFVETLRVDSEEGCAAVFS